MLHEEVSSGFTRVPRSTEPEVTDARRYYHALLTSHHLVSPTKRRLMQQWSSGLGITGFAKVGYPGIIYAEGQQESVEEFVANIKAMQWLALRVRFIELAEPNNSVGSRSDQWLELQKIGEVLEQMRKRDRESLITDLGIGNSSKQ
jgi:acylphosphatase